MKYSVEIVRKHLRRLILAGYFPPGGPLPPIQDLAESIGVSLVTAQAAIHNLRDEGLVEPKRGQGVFVKYPLEWNSRGRRVALLTSLDADFLDHSPYPGESVRALRRGLKEGGYELAPLSLKEIGLADVATNLQERKLAGVVLLEVGSARLIEEIRDAGLPLVSMDYDEYRCAVPSVTFDNLGAGYGAARHLIARGHRRIAFVQRRYRGLRVRSRVGSHTPLDPVTDDRIRGYGLALQDANLPAMVHETADPLDKEGLHALFARRDAPTAVVCDDGLAPELAAAVEELGYAVPEDLSLVGIGASRSTFAEGRGISSIWLDLKGLGRVAAQLFLDALKGEPPRREVLPVRLDPRDSVAEWPAARERMGRSGDDAGGFEGSKERGAKA